MLGTKCLDELLSEREQIAHYMETTLDEATDPWGVKVLDRSHIHKYSTTVAISFIKYCSC